MSNNMVSTGSFGKLIRQARFTSVDKVNSSVKIMNIIIHFGNEITIHFTDFSALGRIVPSHIVYSIVTSEKVVSK